MRERRVELERRRGRGRGWPGAATLRAAAAVLAGALALGDGSGGPGGLVPPAGAAPAPRSVLNRPDRPEPAYVVGHVGVGGTLDYDFCRPSYGVSLLFRPAAAAQFVGALYDWNTALVLQGERRDVSVDRRIFSVGLLLRRYVRDMRGDGPRASPFLGVGLAGAQITYPVAAGAGVADSTAGSAAGDDAGQPGKLTAFSPLAEVGFETSPTPGSVFQAKAQWQAWRRGERDYSGWVVLVGAGIPVPW